MKNYKMVVAYDGRRYKGFRKTKDNDDKTIQGKLEMILFKLFESQIEVVSAVNTDAGVHALQQVVHFKVPDSKMTEAGIYHYFEEFLPDDIVVISVEEVEDRFHSRYNIKSLTYEYRLWKKDTRNRPLFERQYVKVMESPLDVGKMKKAAISFLGEHDFSAFSTKSKVNSSEKNIMALDIEETNNEVIIKIKADGFLLNMERIIVGTLVQIGLGQKKIDSIERAFKYKKKEDIGHKAMGHALCLIDVEY
ncbi:tRNA pseudouridine38-40 synthase [Natranaerovirga pectinivora]|uniref:tRNA pseudouridine synthase A n=1 Tax=Natranaerovirga pectinivora TaxID=682400 RepID=A0A4R3MRP4_9FIRM|nr:tRNA pseudouridine(38-40) synthase TruA [Natranaerovirga pectinivora]TCT16078.1 tRNA pseudouridine38-40 synthase [Natranaerovirga pectinivora]